MQIYVTKGEGYWIMASLYIGIFLYKDKILFNGMFKFQKTKWVICESCIEKVRNEIKT